MSKTKNLQADVQSDENELALKTCFIIMPISDNDLYPPGHFGRVYEYIIKPACLLAGFTPLRADDVKTTNYIALDIVKQIIKADMAICDLSSQNPNVLYEVGIRQAFNLPVTFLKDYKTDRIFDIQGFRDVAYDENLRIDTVEKAVNDLAEMISNTFENKDEVNSLVTLLGIEPAKTKHTTISIETDLILQSLKNLESRISMTERTISQPKISFPIPSESQLMSPSNYSAIKVGDIVYAKVFGKGTVLEIDGIYPDMKAKINFEFIGVKYLLLKFAKLYFIPEN